MTGKSKNIYINQEIWSQPWFIDLEPEQKLTYLYVHTNCNQIGVYLHSDKLFSLHSGKSINEDSLLEWFNQKKERIRKLDDENAFLLTKFLEEENKRGTKIKPTSNPDLGKVREAIHCGLLDVLIELDYFHPDCKLFEYGINEGIISNKSYSIKKKKDQALSDYDSMLQTIIEHQKLTLGKPSISLNSHSKNNSTSHRQSISKGSSTSESDSKGSSPYTLSKNIVQQLYRDNSTTEHEQIKKVQGLANNLFEAKITEPHLLIENTLESLKDHNGQIELTIDKLINEVRETYLV